MISLRQSISLKKIIVGKALFMTKLHFFFNMDPSGKIQYLIKTIFAI